MWPWQNGTPQSMHLKLCRCLLLVSLPGGLFTNVGANGLIVIDLVPVLNAGLGWSVDNLLAVVFYEASEEEIHMPKT